MSIRDELEKLKQGFLQQRDEMKVQANLAKLEIRDEWDKVEVQVEHWLAKLEAVSDEAADASEDVLHSAKHLGEEIKIAYERIKARL
jgi:phage-related minor tail protein